MDHSQAGGDHPEHPCYLQPPTTLMWAERPQHCPRQGQRGAFPACHLLGPQPGFPAQSWFWCAGCAPFTQLTLSIQQPVCAKAITAICLNTELPKPLPPWAPLLERNTWKNKQNLQEDFLHN